MVPRLAYHVIRGAAPVNSYMQLRESDRILGVGYRMRLPDVHSVRPARMCRCALFSRPCFHIFGVFMRSTRAIQRQNGPHHAE
jgi:hypothetical protein